MSAKLAILVVEDDALARKVMASRLTGHAVEFAADAASAKAKLSAAIPDLCFIDLDLGDGQDCSGLTVIPEAVAKGAYAVVMSAHDSDVVVDRAYALGCHDFYGKGNEDADVRKIIARFLARRDKAGREDVFK